MISFLNQRYLWDMLVQGSIDYACSVVECRSHIFHSGEFGKDCKSNTGNTRFLKNMTPKTSTKLGSKILEKLVDLPWNYSIEN